MEEEELKCSRMVKRSQGKKKIGVVNYKERIFVLTPRDFTYYEGSLIVSESVLPSLSSTASVACRY